MTTKHNTNPDEGPEKEQTKKVTVSVTVTGTQIGEMIYQAGARALVSSEQADALMKAGVAVRIF